MLYVQQSLGPGERLIHIGSFHWIYTFTAATHIVFGLIFSGMILAAGIYLPQYINLPFIQAYPAPDAGIVTQIRGTDPLVRILAFLTFLWGIIKFAQMMIIKATTEIAVTTSRVIYKRGIVARFVGEMAIDRIEGVNVFQTFLGRILGYGRLIVRGMGVGEVFMPTIKDPVLFRKAIYKAQSVNKRRATKIQQSSDLDREAAGH